MPKLAIYIPKRDMREIEKWRKKINFSQVFMQALMREIAHRSRSVSADDDKVSAAARHYRKKLASNQQPLVDFGFQSGSDDVLECRLAPETILRLQRIEDSDDPSSADQHEIEKALGDHKAKIADFAAQHQIDESTHPLWRTSICSGYVNGVAAAWKRVCEEMRDV